MNITRSIATERPRSESLVQHRLARTIRMLSLLKAGPIYNTQRLAEEFSVSRRTVYRDLQTLRDAGVPIRIDKWSEAYYVRAQREPGQIHLEHDQAVLLALAAHLSPLNCNRQQAIKIRSAISALIDRLPHAMQLEAGRLLSHTQGETYPLPTAVLDALLRALFQKQPIQVLMETDRGAYVDVRITPSQLIASVDGWQLLGKTAADQNVRTFDVGSFLRVELVEQSQELPSTIRQAVGESL